ncbi:YpdA family putative bacillithiol disulfide reductase [Sediminibacillus dalangtanensis]|uniref:YpdA family putative bacillithiol disulfide reductase n=1 Tax=Sediminibacillus dalangtanensis TaxID=2729421 RepID=A0ABX7VT27_9BACI|nr:YpdA family putative bacillithiol disulfide reductase [Sediminibacillus dalangtanensis]QTM99678.1 YpdA family putative bacillithiol disulfide reductase [Sediminibacillus dalangtanensis]
MQKENTIIIGAGPCGMSAALELQKRGVKPLLIEKGNVVNSIYHYPTHQTFFSSSDRLEIGEIPFITEKKKPVRNQAMAYYRTVAERSHLRINSFERVVNVTKQEKGFQLRTRTAKGEERNYHAEHVVVATGYYDQPRYMGIPGEELPKVMHYFKEAHPYFGQNVVIIGGKNSAVDAALELHKAGANITVLYRGSEYSPSIKPWILPEFASLVRKEIVKMEFNAEIDRITEDEVHYQVDGKQRVIDNDYVFAMTGYQPDNQFLQEMGIEVNKESGEPVYDEETMETNVSDIYIAGVIAAGYNNNKIFIENGRYHGGLIAEAIIAKS